MRFESRFFACLLVLWFVSDQFQTARAADELKRLAFVNMVASSTVLPSEAAFWTRLGELGWIEGRNIAFAKYFGDGDRDRLPTLMTEALHGRPDVIVTPGTQGALEAKRATTKIPIVGLMGDPVGTALVASLSHPGGNLTGVSVQNAEELPTKWIELLRELQPHLSRVAVIVNPENPLSAGVTAQVRRAGSALGIRVIILEAKRPEDYDRLIEQARQRAQALIVWPDSIAIHSRRLIAAQAQKHRLPTLYGQSDFVAADIVWTGSGGPMEARG